MIRPDSVTGAGLFQVVECALQSVGVTAIDDTHCRKLVGIATDGASANIADGGQGSCRKKTQLDFLDVVSSASNGVGYQGCSQWYSF